MFCAVSYIAWFSAGKSVSSFPSVYRSLQQKKKVQILYLIILILVVIIKDLVSLTSDESLTVSQLVNLVINENLHERTLAETLVHVSVGFSREAAAVLVLRESPGL